jgi:DNA-binding MarR family transcriptional regulator
MQLLKPDYIMVPFPIYCDPHLEGLDRIVYGIVYWFEHMKDGRCIASNATIATIAATNVRSISNSLQRLEEAGYIQRLFKDDAKRNRAEIVTKISFKQASKSLAGWMTRDTSKLPTNDSSLDEQNEISNTKELIKHRAGLGAEGEKAIGEIIFLFKDVNPTYKNLYNRKPQRESARRLLETFGMEKLAPMIGYLKKSNGMRFAPTITTPCQFEQKLGELKAWGEKQRAGTKTGKGMMSTTPV